MKFKKKKVFHLHEKLLLLLEVAIKLNSRRLNFIVILFAFVAQIKFSF